MPSAKAPKTMEASAFTIEKGTRDINQGGESMFCEKCNMTKYTTKNGRHASSVHFAMVRATLMTIVASKRKPWKGAKELPMSTMQVITKKASHFHKMIAKG